MKQALGNLCTYFKRALCTHQGMNGFLEFFYRITKKYPEQKSYALKTDRSAFEVVAMDFFLLNWTIL